MANFCKFCGQPLTNGTCTCAASQGIHQDPDAQNMSYQAAPQQAPQYQQPAPNMGQAPQYQQTAPNMGQAPQGGYVPSATAEKSKQIFSACADLVVGILKAPGTAIQNANANQNKMAALILGGVHVVLLFLLTLLSDVKDAETTAKLGLLFALAALVGVLSASVFGLIFGKKNTPNLAFLDVLADYCVATIPGTMLFLIYFITAFINGTFALWFLALCIVAWLIFSQQVTNVVTKNSPMALWANLIASAVGIFIIYFIGKAMLESILTSMMYSMW